MFAFLKDNRGGGGGGGGTGGNSDCNLYYMLCILFISFKWMKPARVAP